MLDPFLSVQVIKLQLCNGNRIRRGIKFDYYIMIAKHFSKIRFKKFFDSKNTFKKVYGYKNLMFRVCFEMRFLAFPIRVFWFHGLWSEYMIAYLVHSKVSSSILQNLQNDFQNLYLTRWPTRRFSINLRLSV